MKWAWKRKEDLCSPKYVYKYSNLSVFNNETCYQTTIDAQGLLDIFAEM